MPNGMSCAGGCHLMMPVSEKQQKGYHRKKSYKDEQIISCRMQPSGTKPGQVMRRLYTEMQPEDTAFAVATGYGRGLPLCRPLPNR